MPTYSYACTVCGHRFDARQSFTDDALTECPECAGLLRKVFSNVGVVFKGSGFYRTDSRGGSTASVPSGSSTSGSGSTESSASGSSDSGSGTSAGSSTSASVGSSDSKPASPAA